MCAEKTSERNSEIKEIDVETPDIFCKEMHLNKYHVETKLSLEKWISKHSKKDWKDDIESTGFCSYCYPHCHDKVKFLLIVKILTWAFLLDDYLDRKPEQFQYWLKVVEAKRHLSDHYLEIMYEEIYTELDETLLTYNQKLRVKLSLVKLIQSYSISGKIRNKERKITLNEFKSFRYADSLIDTIFVFVEWYLEININILWTIRSFQRFHERIVDHAQIINDIYSYKKELKTENNIAYTYMSVLRQCSNISFEESLRIAVERVGILEKEIEGLVKDLELLSLEVPKVYIDHVCTIIHGNHYWSKICGRYNLI